MSDQKLVSEERLTAAADDPIVWAGEMELVQRAFEMQHPLEEGQVRLTQLVAGAESAHYELVIQIARSMEQKAIGWLGLADASEAVGVLFEEPGDSTRAFHNRGVDAELDLWTFDATGKLLERFELAADASTPVRPRKAYRWALETPKGTLAELTGEVVLTVPAAA
jgi:uncharacterized membrane protein (UPF0127 family)